MKDAWIAAHRRPFALNALCGVLEGSVSGYRAWTRGGTPHRHGLTDPRVPALTQAMHAELKGAYGRPRRVREVRARGFPASQARVEHLMRAHGLRGRHQRRFKATTDSRHPLPVAENRLARDVGPSAPNPVWTLEIASLWTDEGWLDLASALDRFNCEVVGWSLRPRLTADLVTDALTMAWFRRRPAPGAMQHSDRGSRSAGHAFREQPTESGMVCSMSRNGNCRDHAPTESGFNSFKNARVFGERFSTREAMKATAFESIEVFDSRMRRHSTPGYTSPPQFLQDRIKTQPHEQQGA